MEPLAVSHWFHSDKVGWAAGGRWEEEMRGRADVLNSGSLAAAGVGGGSFVDAPNATSINADEVAWRWRWRCN